MPPLPADFIHARACKLKCEKILTRPHLREKLNDTMDNPKYIRTIWGVGYKIED